MKRFVGIVLILTVLAGCSVPSVLAASDQAYRDFQYHYDLYRSRANDYRIALNQYQQFRSLAAQQDTIEKVRLLIAQRDTASKTYFLFLNEKLTENPGATTADLALYRTAITNQIQLLDANAVLAPAIGSMEDAKQTAEAFANNYETMQGTYRQIVVTLELGYLRYFSNKIDELSAEAQALINDSRADSTPQKQSVLDRWLLSISNKRTLYEQKANSIRTNIPKLTGDLTQQDQVYAEMQTNIGSAKADLVDSASYLKEIVTALTYD